MGCPDMMKFHSHVDGVAYTTCELIGRDDRPRNDLGDHELMICLPRKVKHNWATDTLCGLAYYTMETPIQPGETCDIGTGVKLYQGVTLGALSFPRDADGNIIRGMKRHPMLEDEVVVYANATILGGDTVVGHHAVIGSSVWLTKSVAPYTVVSMEKPSLRIRGPETKTDFLVDFQI